MDIRLIVIAVLIGILLPFVSRHGVRRRKKKVPAVHRWRHRLALRENKYPYEARSHLLTIPERALLHALDAAVGNRYRVAMSVRLADVIECSPKAWRDGHGPLISSKQLDFVLCEPETTRIIAAIELDDPTHDQADRRERDEFLDRAMDAAGVPLIRVRTASRYDPARLRDLVASAVARRAGRVKAA